ncbi:MBL fold metallo-hydrolase [Pseudarthrobacter sp. P1]|uniref:MBL fold metallo-hydrolase n=1 Tax=Pseudarthrobacter sp. P1 TaxID=3418418 RepID=UPI003CF21D6C
MDATSPAGSAGTTGAGRWSTASALARCLLASNPGPMTLDGTNSYALAAPGSASVVLVDPGPLEEDHLVALAASGTVELVLLTHHHLDHTAGSARLHALTGAPVRAADPAFCLGGEPLAAGEWIEAAGLRIQVLATPGHTGDSLCFWLPGDGPAGAVLTGDTVLGRGSSIIAHPDGNVADYLHSLSVLAGFTGAAGLPAHGPVLADVALAAQAYRTHRLERLDEVRAALATLGPDASAQAAADVVYADVPAALRPAALASMAAQLEYLRR